MNPSTSALSKKTKAEILTEYEKLLAIREDALHLAHEVHDPQHVAQMRKIQK